jgi:hypothetical protein
MKTLKQATALLALCSIFFAPALFCQMNWTQKSDHCVIDCGKDGEWDGGSTLMPFVFKEGDTLKMWYTGTEGPVMTTRWRKGCAWSLDGVSWHKHSGNPIKYDHELEAMIKDGDSYEGWCRKNDIVCYTTSTNGINWTPFIETNLQLGDADDWDADIFIFRAGPVVKDSAGYKMWYMGSKGPTTQIGLATSSDGIHWQKYNDPATTDPPFANSDPVLKVGSASEWDSNSVLDHWVSYSGKGYEMWYSGGSGGVPSIGYATSIDGINWTKHPDNPIHATKPVWGTGFITCCVLEFDNSYHMWYGSYVKSDQLKIGYMTSPIETRVETGKTDNKNPNDFKLTNYPNPFNPTTTIEFTIRKSKSVTLEIFNPRGELVETMLSERCGEGSHRLTWNAAHQPSGVYFCRLRGESFSQVGKMLLVR